MRRLLTAAVITLCLVPGFTSALTIQDLTDKIAALLAQVAELQQQVVQATAQEQSQTAPSVSDASPTSSTCPTIVRPLSQGSRGDDVLQLQQFLVSHEALSPDGKTGFFGPLTEAAVQKWQSAHGVVSSGSAESTGWGMVGSRTRMAILGICGGDITPPQSTNDKVNVSIQGLAATISSTVNGRASCAAQTYTLDYGDGASTAISVPVNTCHPITQDVSHTYAREGSYTVVLSSASVTVRVPITVSNVGTTACSMIALVCPTGQHVVRDGCSQSCAIDDIVGILPSCPIYMLSRLACPVGFHDVSGPSTKDSNGCPIPSSVCVPDTVTSGAPVVTGVDGPASLNVGQQGTWTVHASVPNNPGAQIRYAVVWGDEAPYALLQAFASDLSSLTTSSTFTHIYSAAGTFRPTFTVSNDAGSAQTSSSVSVGNGGACAMYALVCPVGQHDQVDTACNHTCVNDKIVPSCPLYMLSLCPFGYHHGANTIGSDGCPMPGSCVPDDTASVSVSVSASLGVVSSGQGINFSWSAQNAPSGAVVQLDLVDASTNAVVGDGVMCGNGDIPGSCTWTVPYSNNAPYSYCPRATDMPGICGAELVSGKQYKVRAQLQSGFSCRGFCMQVATQLYATSYSDAFTINTSAGSVSSSPFAPTGTYPAQSSIKSGDTSSSLASAYVALESALKALLDKFGR